VPKEGFCAAVNLPRAHHYEWERVNRNVDNDKDRFDDEDELLAAARRSLSEDHPNPERSDCPEPEAIRLLAFDPMKADCTLNLHLTMCSPCFRLYSQYLAEARDGSKGDEQSR
jgi:hypothetical protein